MGNAKKAPVKRIRADQKSSHGKLALVIALIIGLVAVIVALALVFLVFFHGKKPTKEMKSNQIESDIGKDTLDIKKKEETETESETFSIQERIMESTEGETQKDGVTNSVATHILNQMTTEEKIDQLFILPPVVMINSTPELEAGNEVSVVNMVGEQTRQSYEEITAGGFLISEDNIDPVTKEVQPFIMDLENLKDKKYGLSPFIAVTQAVIERIGQGNSADFSLDITYSELTPISNNLNLMIDVVDESITAEDVFEKLQNRTDLFIVDSLAFDYGQLRSNMTEYVERMGMTVQNALDDKVSAIIQKKTSGDQTYNNVISGNATSESVTSALRKYNTSTKSATRETDVKESEQTGSDMGNGLSDNENSDQGVEAENYNQEYGADQINNTQP